MGAIAVALALCLPASPRAVVQPALPRAIVEPAPLDAHALTVEIDRFLLQEATAHFAGIASLDPPPDRVLGARTVGEFSWGTFMRALAAIAEHAHAQRLADRDVPQWVGRMGLIEARAGSKAFSQLYAALALQHYGERLDANRLWQSLTPGERDEWRSLLDVRRFYDPAHRRVIDLAENYLGVAARVAAIGYRVGLTADRAPLDALLDRAAEPFSNGRLFADDAPPTGRFDRYSNEYARFVWDAAQQADRPDILAMLRPSLTTQMRLWWDLVDGGDGYGYPWGRSLGVVSYMDTLEIVAFLAQHPELRPAPLADLVSQYARAWSYLRHDFRDDRHLLSLFEFGRGNYAYISLDREWQQTTGFLGKAQVANAGLAPALEREQLTTYPSEPSLPPVKRFQFFRSTGDRVAGVWVVRQDRAMRFALPITTGTRPGVADYLPAPHGLPGFAVPVEQNVPALTPYLELEDGRTIVATDGADEIDPSADGNGLSAVWRRWAVIGTKSGQLIDPGLTSEVRWTIDAATLTRVETLTARAPLTVRRWRVVVPSTAASAIAQNNGVLLRGDTEIRLKADTTSVAPDVRPQASTTAGAALRVAVDAPWKPQATIQATGNGPLGRGARGYIPLHVAYEARDVRILPGQPLTWRLTLTTETSR